MLQEGEDMNIEQRVISAVEKNLETKCEVRLESKLKEDLGVDSFSALMVINELEDEFSITIDETDFRTLKRVSDIVDRLKSKYLMREHVPAQFL